MSYKDPREPFTRIEVDEAKELMEGGGVEVIDVREPHEYHAGHIPAARLIPVNSVFSRQSELPRDRPIVFVCATGQRSALAAEMAAAAGLTNDLYNLEGGTVAWVDAGEPLE